MSEDSLITAGIDTAPPEEVRGSDDVDLGNSRRQEKLKRYQDNTRIRKGLNLWGKSVISVWLGLVIILVYMLGFGLVSYSCRGCS